MPGAHERALEALKRRGRLRTLEARSGLDFASNDYLGLATSGALNAAAQAALERGVAVGAGGSRLLRGNDPEHEALESEAAEHFRAESALFFGGGFQANYAIFSTLPARGDLVVHDGLIHASVLDGIRAGKADHVSTPHNDAGAIEAAISRWRADGGTGKPWIAVESLYSMDGDTAPLSDLTTIADRHDAMLVIDEAHATGVLGPDGRGLAAHLEGRDNVVSLHTCGKALGASGALLLSTRTVRDFLVNRCRPFIYATAPSPLMAAVVRESLRICRDEPQRRTDLAKRVARIRPGRARLAHCARGGRGRFARDHPGCRIEGARLRCPRHPAADGARGDRAASGCDHAECFGGRCRGAIRGPPGRIGETGSMSAGFIVAGTDTGVGKTVFAAGLVTALGGRYWKPIQAGLDGETDGEAVRRLTADCDVEIINEIYRLKQLMSPHLAAARDGIEIDLARLTLPQNRKSPVLSTVAPQEQAAADRSNIVALKPRARSGLTAVPGNGSTTTAPRPLVIEGAGGVMVPLNRQAMQIDLFDNWALPVVVVARTSLGTINHTLLTIEALRRRNIMIQGVAFVGDANNEVEEDIASFGRVRRLGRLPWLDPLDSAALKRAFDLSFRLEDFQQ